MASEAEQMKARLRQAFELFEIGVSVRRSALRREHPEADAAEIDRLLREWLTTRPGAELGDTVGIPRQLERNG